MRYLIPSMLLAAAACSMLSAAPLSQPAKGAQLLGYVPGEIVLNPDEYEVVQDSVIEIAAPGVLANDSLAPDDHEVSLIWGPSHGVLAFKSDGSFVYRPNPGFTGDDEFGYGVEVSGEAALVSIRVLLASTAPIAYNDVYEMLEDGQLHDPSVSVLDNDRDPEGLGLVAEIESQPGHGDVELQQDGTFLYIPHHDFAGKDSFSYTAVNSHGETSQATVTIIVHGLNDAPSFTGGADIHLQMGGQDVTIAGWATDISAGPANESGQPLFFMVSILQDDANILAMVPMLDASGDLTISLVPGAEGTALLQAVLYDEDPMSGDSMTSEVYEFSISVANSYVAPSFESLDLVQVMGVAGEEYKLEFAWDISAGSDSNPDELEFAIIDIGNADMFLGVPSIDAATGELTFVLAQDGGMVSDLIVVLQDVNGVHVSDIRSFTIEALEIFEYDILAADMGSATPTADAGRDESGCASKAGGKSWLYALGMLGLLSAVCVHRRRTA